MAILREEVFMNTDIAVNSNKVWKIQEHDTPPSVTTLWGRVGDSLQTKTWGFASQTAASAAYEKKKKDKLKVKTGRDAYTKIEVLGGETKTTTSVKGDLADIAAKQIEADCEETSKLIKWLTEVNVHQILSSTTLTYNADEGVFKTPLGVVGPSSIDRARILLAEMEPSVKSKQYDDAALKKCVNEYLRLIPQDLGRARDKLSVARIFPDINAVVSQAELVDKLEASIQGILTKPASRATVKEEKGDEPRVFNAKLSVVADDQKLAEIKAFYEKTRNKMHSSYNYKPTRVWAVELGDMKAKFEKDGAKLDNIWRLWHGTKPHNLLSILKVGLIIPKHYTHGWAFGAGVYFSDQSTKSLQYASGYWSRDGKSESQAYMFLADVGMGKFFNASSTFSTPKAGYDSCFARGTLCKDERFKAMDVCGSLYNNEMIIYRTSQCNLVYLVEFKEK